jgi:hypothetical protein
VATHILMCCDLGVGEIMVAKVIGVMPWKQVGSLDVAMPGSARVAVTCRCVNLGPTILMVLGECRGSDCDRRVGEKSHQSAHGTVCRSLRGIGASRNVPS